MYPCGAVLYRYLPQLLWMLWDVGHLGEWEHCGIHSRRLRPISLCHEGHVLLDGIVRRVWWVSRVACRVYVKWLKIYHAARFAIFLCAEHHAMAPCYRFTDGRRLYNSKPHVLIMSCLDILLPMYLDRDRWLVGDRFGIRFHHQTHSVSSH